MVPKAEPLTVPVLLPRDVSATVEETVVVSVDAYGGPAVPETEYDAEIPRLDLAIPAIV